MKSGNEIMTGMTVIKTPRGQIICTLVFLLAFPLACGDSNDGSDGSQPDAGADATGADDGGSEATCSTEDGGDISEGDSLCRDNLQWLCTDGEMEETAETCGLPASDVEILDNPDVGLVRLGSDSYVSTSFVIRNAGDAKTENLSCSWDLVYPSGTSDGVREIFLMGIELEPGETYRAGDERGVPDENVEATITVLCTADNESASAVDSNNRFSAEVP